MKKPKSGEVQNLGYDYGETAEQVRRMGRPYGSLKFNISDTI